jgi:hypothetical protein
MVRKALRTKKEILHPLLFFFFFFPRLFSGPTWVGPWNLIRGYSTKAKSSSSGRLGTTQTQYIWKRETGTEGRSM